MSSLSSPAIVTTEKGPLITDLPPRPPPPPPAAVDDDSNHDSDDSSDDGHDDKTKSESHDDDDHKSTSVLQQPSDSSRSSPPGTATTSFVSSSSTDPTGVTITSASSGIAATTAKKISTSSSLQESAPATSAFDHSGSDSTPVSQGDPVLEGNTNPSGLGTAGIVLAAVFGFVALVTTFYLLYRLVRHRRAYRRRSSQSELPRSNTFDGQDSVEKGLTAGNTTWPSPKQETGVIFGRRSTLNNQSEQQQHGQGRSSFSFFNWARSSTSTAETAANNNASPHPRATHTTWNTSSIFNLNFILGRRASQPFSTASTSTTRLNDPYTEPYSVDVNRTSSHRSNGSVGSGSGHARAYAHHNIRAPQSVARSAISSISSRWLKRRSGADSIPASPARNRPISEISDMYGAGSSVISGPKSPASDGRQSEHMTDGKSTTSSTPRLPPPILVGEPWSIRLSV